jgi:hypothetical protein
MKFEHISPKLQAQMNLYNQAPPSFKTYYIERYVNGSICSVNNKPREVTVFYYCDYFNPSNEFSILELSEPDWCKYHVKVATKYMCGRGNMMPTDYFVQNVHAIKCMTRPISGDLIHL